MEKKVCLITGGTSGIGLALARAFSGAGYAVAITGRHALRLDEARRELEQAGAEVLALQADAEKEDEQAGAVAGTLGHFGRLDVLINNAGVSMRALFGEVKPEVFRKVMETNFFGTVSITRAALPHLMASQGCIVGISSVAGLKGLPGRTAYSASKFAMQGFLESLETELLPHGVHVLFAYPGFTASRIRENSLTATGEAQGQSPRDEAAMMQPDEVARRILEAVGQRRRSVVMTREGRLTFWLNKFFPRFVRDQVYRKMAAEPGSGMPPLT
jgi:dehydrogenase/reductase SDR family protein 7B